MILNFGAKARLGVLDFFDEKSKKTWSSDHPPPAELRSNSVLDLRGQHRGKTVQKMEDSPAPNANHDRLGRESA